MQSAPPSSARRLSLLIVVEGEQFLLGRYAASKGHEWCVARRVEQWRRVPCDERGEAEQDQSTWSTWSAVISLTSRAGELRAYFLLITADFGHNFHIIAERTRAQKVAERAQALNLSARPMQMSFWVSVH